MQSFGRAQLQPSSSQAELQSAEQAKSVEMAAGDVLGQTPAAGAITAQIMANSKVKREESGSQAEAPPSKRPKGTCQPAKQPSGCPDDEPPAGGSNSSGSGAKQSSVQGNAVTSETVSLS